jgi:cell pole-organizing protein PopZ
MSEPKTQEPTMEEILASIRRMISENAEDDNPAKKEAGAEPGEVLELTQMIKEDGSMVDLTKEESEPESEPETETEPAAAEPAAEPESDDERLVSTDAADAASKPFADLARVAEPEPASATGPTFGDSGRTVEDLVMELMRPMLREWLDDNLPSLVERLVQKEIRYLVRRSEPE